MAILTSALIGACHRFDRPCPRTTRLVFVYFLGTDTPLPLELRVCVDINGERSRPEESGCTTFLVGDVAPYRWAGDLQIESSHRVIDDVVLTIGEGAARLPSGVEVPMVIDNGPGSSAEPVTIPLRIVAPRRSSTSITIPLRPRDLGCRDAAGSDVALDDPACSAVHLQLDVLPPTGVATTYGEAYWYPQQLWAVFAAGAANEDIHRVAEMHGLRILYNTGLFLVPADEDLWVVANELEAEPEIDAAVPVIFECLE